MTLDQLWGLMQRTNYVRAVDRGGEKFNDVTNMVAQHTFRELDKALRIHG